MFYVILGLGEQKSILRSICVHFKIIFHTNLKKMLLQGGTPRLIKSLPCAENFFLSLPDDIFVICNLKVIKNQRNTYYKMHFDQNVVNKSTRYIFQAISPECGGKSTLHYKQETRPRQSTPISWFL